MIKDFKILAIVPARAGSKRLVGKNMLPLGGKPLLEWTLDVVKDFAGVVEIVLSSDGAEALALAKQKKIPTVSRPKLLSSDTATSYDVVEHSVLEMERRGGRYDAVLLLQPTSPLRSSTDIQNAISLFRDKQKVGSVISVCKVAHPPEWSGTLGPDGSMDNLVDKLSRKRSQDFEPHYRLNGAIYLIDREQLLIQKTLFPKPVFASVMPPERSVDIDTRDDFEIAKLYLNSIE